MTQTNLVEEAMRCGAVLKIVNQNAPYAINTEDILHKIKTQYPSLKVYASDEVKTYLWYLQGHALIILTETYNFSREKPWSAVISSAGYDYCRNNNDSPKVAGIIL